MLGTVPEEEFAIIRIVAFPNYLQSPEIVT